MGHLAVYIDDLRATGEVPILNSFWGLEVDRREEGILTHQQSYVRDLLRRHGTQGSSTMSTAAVPEEEGEPCPRDVKQTPHRHCDLVPSSFDVSMGSEATKG